MAPTPDGGAKEPTLARQALGVALLNARQRARMDRQRVAGELGVHLKTIDRIEKGLTGTKTATVRMLCQLYGLPADQMAELTRMAVEGSARGWWEENKLGAGPSRFPVFAENEQRAVRIQSLEMEIVPGLLQTPAYLEAVQDAQPWLTKEIREAVAGLRFQRQELLWGRADPAPQVEMAMGLAAIRYLDDLPGVRDEQLARLTELARRPNVEIRVMTTIHAGMSGPFTILTPGSGASPWVYEERIGGCSYTEGKAVAMYLQSWEALFAAATPIEEYLS